VRRGAATLCEAFDQTAQTHAERRALSSASSDIWWTWSDYRARVHEAAGALAALGTVQGDTVALMLVNRLDFHVLDTAAMLLGATPLSIYNTSSPEQIAHLLAHADATVLITEEALLSNVVAADTGALPVFCVDSEHADAPAWADVVRHSAGTVWHPAPVEPEDIATIIYTSGTTGHPKGVQISHRAAVAMAKAFATRTLIDDASVHLISYLPMAHAAERLLSHWIPTLYGSRVSTCADPRAVGEVLPAVQPDFFFSPPRLLEKLQATVIAHAEGDPDYGQQLLHAIQTGRAGVRTVQNGEQLAAATRDELMTLEPLLAAVRARLGFGRLRCMVTGSAPVPHDLIEFYLALGVPIVEAYGMSETVTIAVDHPGASRVGTVGPPLPGFEVRLADDGEILARGPAMMTGYRKDPEQTTAAIDSDGWLHTGDIGSWDTAGNLQIVDRKKEIIISAAGKNMSPANVEAQLKASSPLIGQAVCIGDGRAYNVALLVLDPDAAAVHGGVGLAAKAADVLDAVAQGVRRANARLSRVEQIKRYEILDVDWMPDSDELTPTMKLKRREITQKYAAVIEELYSRT
jgi:long-subunit acyl-CoA synthetase (AMP-forming)